MKTKDLTFIVDNSGDWDVGLSGFRIKVNVEDRQGILSECNDARDNFIVDIKAVLLSHFSDYDGITSVYTRDELDAMISGYEGNNT